MGHGLDHIKYQPGRNGDVGNQQRVVLLDPACKDFCVVVSLLLCFSGVWMVPSGMALHFALYEGTAKWRHLLMSMHIAAALFFVAAVGAHLILNRKVFSRYIKARVAGYPQFKRELMIAVLGVSGFVLLVASHTLHLV